MGTNKDTDSTTKIQQTNKMIAEINHQLCDTKVSTDTKRILRLPSTIYYKVSMKCIAVKKIERFDTFRKQCQSL